MNLLKCDKCGNRNIMCFSCEKNNHYRETNRSHDNFIRVTTIDKFTEQLKSALSTGNLCEESVDKIAEKLKNNT